MDAITEKIWMDGTFVDWNQANVHILTHTLHYGWGVFEGIRCYQCADGSSAVFRLKEHVDRLFDSAHIVSIPVPYTREQISEAILETLRVNKVKEAYIRPIIFIGDGEMGIYVKKLNVRVAIAVWGWGAYLGAEGLNKGIRAKVASYTRLHVNAQMTKAKVVGNYVNSILAKREVIVAGYDEAIMLDTAGYVSEASGENVFFVKNGTIKTTPLQSILPGITRDSVLTIVRDKGYPLREERFTRDELYLAEEAFFSGTAAEITPIREVDNRMIGPGIPGPITSDVQATFFDTVRGKVDRYRSWLTPVYA
ncbi:MAG TPA: branched-chain amino acid transaminase [Thermodesulfobacteriota bacterium]|nr:branched-chain amino acid transaminase [Deltaproteobacteria bacterium]HNR12844.1 branched-chain amino acid transaminase [Thermodesulfobacteriota bacterium]HNU71614.1 branched-chain amino acid transaminase [Thermodesulfobacteriota bacterium]HOC38338.1 branched-chain amino acid transaminase [Thermodesulfobacteriota bacterium]HQO78057.1 branched-chain amino acid transaminase [Thermodesulfobacteriota bacterium]